MVGTTSKCVDLNEKDFCKKHDENVICHPLQKIRINSTQIYRKRTKNLHLNLLE